MHGNTKALFDRNPLRLKFFKTILDDANKNIIYEVESTAFPKKNDTVSKYNAY